MKKPLAIDPEVIKRLGSLEQVDRAQCLQTLCDLCDVFGKPHLHSGLGVRKLGAHLFECRANLSLRFVFQDRPDCLYIRFLGTHDEVQRLLRGRKG